MKNNGYEYGHVGRPTNEEVMKKKKKRNLKIIGIVSLFLFVFGAGFIFLNKESLFLDSIMGNSTYIASMKNVQNSSKYDEILFIPTLKQKNVYYLNSKEEIKNSLLNQLEFDEKKYQLSKIQFFSDGKYLKSVNQNTKKLSFSSDYIGKTLALRYYLKNKKTGKISTKYAKFIITSYVLELENGQKLDEQSNELLIKIIREMKIKKKLESIKNNNIDNIFENSVDEIIQKYEREELESLSKLSEKNIRNCKISYPELRWPVNILPYSNPGVKLGYGTVTVKGKKTSHYGIDIAGESFSDKDIPIVAVYDGKVVKTVNYEGNTLSKTSKENYGTYVVLEHKYNGRKIFSIYAHMKYNSIPKNIKNGAIVKAGDKLGIMGNTGSADGKILHFEMRKNDIKSNTRKQNNLNPLDYISSDMIIICDKIFREIE